MMKFRLKKAQPTEPEEEVPRPKRTPKVKFGHKQASLPPDARVFDVGLRAIRSKADNRARERGSSLQEMMDKKYGEHVFTVKLGYNDTGLEESQMLMEIASMRPKRIPIDPAWGVVEWRQFMDSEGQHPFHWCASHDIEMFHKLIFAAEYLRTFETHEDRRANGLNKPINPEWDSSAPDLAQDGRTWGSVDMEDWMPMEPTGDKGLSHTLDQVKPVREQVQERQEAVIEAHKNQLVPVNLDKVRELEKDPELQKWEVAIGLARKPRSEWEGKLDFEMEQRVKYCYGWLRDIGDVPRPYPQDVLELFWPVMKSLGNERDIERRTAVSEKITKFWRKSVSENGTGIDLHSESYRVTLAAMQLDALIEHHVSNYRRIDHENSLEQLDATSMGQIKQAAVRYFQAHFPVQSLGAEPGPINTLDPDYVEYVRLCRKYNLPEGTILHEVNI